jgi:hypothetical protein
VERHLLQLCVFVFAESVAIDDDPTVLAQLPAKCRRRQVLQRL